MIAVANRKVLVLNKTWNVVNVCNLQRAISLIFCEKAQIIDPYEQFATYTWDDWSKLRPKANEDFIQTAKQQFRVPEVILLNHYDKIPRKKLKFSRRMIYKRDEGLCQYCGRAVGGEGSIDHVFPRCRGGQTTWQNVVLSCLKCNVRKGSKTLHECGMKLLKQPVKPKMQDMKLDKKSYPKSWEQFATLDVLVSAAYWEIELENDN